jgi:tetratricopeptide (TPR) repeat protein
MLSDVAGRTQDAAAYANLGMAYLTARRLDEATTAFNRALQIDPTLAEAHCGRGMVLQQQSKWEEAVEAFTSTETLAPDNPAGPMNLGLALEALGQQEEALAAYRRAAAIAPDDEDVRQALERFAVPEPINDEATRPALAVDKGTAAIAGNLKSFQLLDVLEFLRLQNASGQLVLTSHEGAAVVRLARGRVTSATAPRVKRLGEMLVELRVITDDQLESALAQQRGYEDEALARRLLSDGVDQNKLVSVTLKQIIAVLDNIMDWPDGAFSFQRGEEREQALISFDLQEVMLELMKTRDERGR